MSSICQFSDYSDGLITCGVNESSGSLAFVSITRILTWWLSSHHSHCFLNAPIVLALADGAHSSGSCVLGTSELFIGVFAFSYTIFQTHAFSATDLGSVLCQGALVLFHGKYY